MLVILMPLSDKTKNQGQSRRITPDKWLCVNEFCVDNFHCPVADIVHPLNPQYLIFSLEFLRDTLFLGKFLYALH